jgi:hypothetical protein
LAAKFNDTFKNNAYLQKMEMAFSFWEQSSPNKLFTIPVLVDVMTVWKKIILTSIKVQNQL